MKSFKIIKLKPALMILFSFMILQAGADPGLDAMESSNRFYLNKCKGLYRENFTTTSEHFRGDYEQLTQLKGVITDQGQSIAQEVLRDLTAAQISSDSWARLSHDADYKCAMGTASQHMYKQLNAIQLVQRGKLSRKIERAKTSCAEAHVKVVESRQKIKALVRNAINHIQKVEGISWQMGRDHHGSFGLTEEGKIILQARKGDQIYAYSFFIGNGRITGVAHSEIAPPYYEEYLSGIEAKVSKQDLYAANLIRCLRAEEKARIYEDLKKQEIAVVQDEVLMEQQGSSSAIH